MSGYDETKRLERRRQLARQEVRNYEDQLSNYELILMRLDAVPDELQEPNHEQVRAETVANIERSKYMIRIMREEAGPEETVSRQQRRAEARAAAKEASRRAG